MSELTHIGPDGTALYARMIARPDHVAGALEMMARWDLDPMLSRLDALAVPVTLFVGARDQTVPPGEAIRLGATHDAITVIDAGELGHLMHEEAPEIMADMIQKALNPDDDASG